MLSVVYAGHMAVAYNRAAMDAALTHMVVAGVHGFSAGDGDLLAMTSVLGAACGNLAGAALAPAATAAIGSKWSFVLSLAAPAMASAAIVAVAAAHATSVVSMVSLWFLARTSEALLRPSMVETMNATFPRGKLGSAWGVLSTSSRAGAVVGGLCFGALLLHGAEWWALFASAAVVLAACATAAALLLPVPATVGKQRRVRDGGASKWRPTRSFWVMAAYAAALMIVGEFKSLMPRFQTEYVRAASGCALVKVT